MTNPSPHDEPVRAALRDAVLALGGMVAMHPVGEDLGAAVARALRGVICRHLRVSVGMSSSMKPSMPLRPHPAITRLLDLIGSAPDRQERQVAASEGPTTPTVDDDDWLRLPGLFRSWELDQVVDADHAFQIEPAGHCEDGTRLFAVYAQTHERRDAR